MMDKHGAGPYKHIYRQNGRCLVSTLLLNFPDFAFKDKAKNAFLLRDFSPDATKIGIPDGQGNAKRGLFLDLNIKRF